MHPVNFDGAVEIRKPENMTDEECMSIWAAFGFGRLYEIFKAKGIVQVPPGLIAGIDEQGFSYYTTAWRPNKEDLEALNRGQPVYVRTLTRSLPPMSLFTLDENGEGNF